MANEFRVYQQVHSYRNGHSLAGASAKLSRADQDLVDRLSDLAGPLGPGQTFSPYLTFYPLGGEPYFVVARTWQDLDAPRAGCVITRSLLVPIEVWRNGGVIAPLLRALQSEGSDQSRFNELEMTREVDAELPTLEVAKTIEFVEAFFLEQRQPIVVFDGADPETFACRLLEGLWPALRASVAICTHAYSPRTFHGRPFDLIFAPLSARSNFSGWAGRKIDGQATNRQARHNWTTSISRRLFAMPVVEPLSVTFGEFDFSNGDADESQFRLAMLWDELAHRTEESPLAILGMLDIVSSLGRNDVSVSRLLGKSLEKAIRMAAGLEMQTFLEFLLTLLGKFPSRLPPTATLNQIRRSVAHATEENPDEALLFLRKQGSETSTPPAIIMAGIARGLAKCQWPPTLVHDLLGLQDEALLALLGYGPGLARRLIGALESNDGVGGFSRLEQIASTADTKLRDRVRRNLIPVFTHSGESRILASLLRGADGRAVSSSVRWLDASGAIGVAELRDALLGAADTYAKTEALRSALTRLPVSNGADSLIARTVANSQDGFEWLLGGRFDEKRTGIILRDVLSRCSDAELRRIPSAQADEILVAADLLEGCMKAESIRRILSFVPSTCDAMLRVSLADPTAIVAGESLGFLKQLLSRVFTEGARYELAMEAIERFGPRVAPRELSLMAAAQKIRTEQLSINLELFASASQDFQKHLASRVDVLTEQIVGRRGLVPSLNAIAAWAQLIAVAIRGGEASAFRASSEALEFALKATKVQVSPLLRIVYPSVYAHLRGSESTPSILGFFAFHDWDRCKTARKDLVRAFLGSVWPPADLLRIADSVMEAESFSWILGGSPGGRELLHDALSDPTLPMHVRNEFLRYLST